MRIVVIGAGAVGGYFAGRLAEAGEDVAVVARGETLDVLQQTGMTLIDVPHPPRRVTIPAYPSLAAAGDCDIVLVATKALDGTDAFAGLAGLSPGATVITLQNAVGAPHAALELVGEPGRVWPGVVRGFLHHTGPGVVEFHGGPLSLTFGTWGGERSELAEEFAQRLSAAGVAAVVHPDIWQDIWAKAMFVSSFSLLGALTGKPLGDMLADELLAHELRCLMAEVEAAARGAGVALPPDIVADTMAFAAAMPPTSTSSLQRDLLAGAAAELGAQIGAISKLARSFDVPAPRFAFGYALLLARR